MFSKITTASVLLPLMMMNLMACNQAVSFALPETSDTFDAAAAYNNKVDVIFVMDNSSGMEDHNRKLRESLPSLVSTLLSQKLDLHVAVITTSMGGGNPNGGRFLGEPRFLSNATPNLSGVLVDRLNSVGNDGSDNERGLDSLAAVMSPSYLANEGRGFLRDDAFLAVITLSSEDDKSANLNHNSGAYQAILDDNKGFFEDGARRWALNFIGILSLSDSCSTTSGPGSNYKEPGLRWLALANVSNGVKESICSPNLATAASNIRSRLLQILSEFRLKKKPVIESIVVVVNGNVVPRSTDNGWDYIVATNSIRFYGTAMPAADATIKVDFTPAEAN